MNINENSAESRSQVSMILDWMLRGNSITPLEALERFRCFRLGARIADIKKLGFPVRSEFISTPTQKKVKRYYF